MLREKNSNKFHGLINKSAEYVPDYTQNKLWRSTEAFNVDNLTIYCFNIMDAHVQLEGLRWLETASSTF